MKKEINKIAFSTEEAAFAIGTTPAVMANWRCAKVGPKYYKQNRKVFYLYEDLTAWLKMHPVITKDAHDIEAA
ncbi:MAG TPA: hypothetical protein PLP16_09740 [Smithellaceae bacterium]|nr:hypothetical protein [Smithellaceae bacterium]